MKVKTFKRTFNFIEPAVTSRRVYTQRNSWMVEITDENNPQRHGMGECAPLPRLSCDDIPDYENVLEWARITIEESLNSGHDLDYVMTHFSDLLRPFPSIRFGFETALIDFFSDGTGILFDTPFSRGEEGIPVNGLVWMGCHRKMSARLEEKLSTGFHCIKIKVGAIDFDKEMDLLRRIRERFSADEVTIRLDANGNFKTRNVLKKLEKLAKYDIHSIEQPIRQYQWKKMARICKSSPIPIALDEELTGVNLPWKKDELLDEICPQYLVLKPSLHGGFIGCNEWIEKAKARGIGTWITSSLESNVGLNAIAQFAAHVYGPDIKFHQGLGTGQLFSDNIEMPLELRGEYMWRK